MLIVDQECAFLCLWRDRQLRVSHDKFGYLGMTMAIKTGGFRGWKMGC